MAGKDHDSGTEPGFSRENKELKGNVRLPGKEMVEKALLQMKEKGATWWDMLEEYYTGTCIVYSWNEKMNSFWRTESDVIAASFNNDIPMTENEMAEVIAGVSISELEEAGFLLE